MADVGQPDTGSPQPAHGRRLLKLGLIVVPVSRGRVDHSRDENAGVRVRPQHLGRESTAAGEVTDGEHVVHDDDHEASPPGKVNSPKAPRPSRNPDGFLRRRHAGLFIQRPPEHP
jgi:hypothetical protein